MLGARDIPRAQVADPGTPRQLSAPMSCLCGLSFVQVCCILALKCPVVGSPCCAVCSAGSAVTIQISSTLIMRLLHAGLPC